MDRPACQENCAFPQGGQLKHATSTTRGLFGLSRVTAGMIALLVGLGPPLAVAQDLRLREIDRFGTSSIEVVPLPTTEQLAEVQLTPSIIMLVLQLDDPLFENREAAVEHLRELQPTRLMLHKLLRQTSLSIEQRERLLLVARDEIEMRPRGALGVRASFQRSPLGEPLGSVIKELIPGLPAIELLKRNDVVTHVDGVALTQAGSLGAMVQLKRPGEAVRLTVLRTTRNDEDEGEDPTETIEIVFDLGSMAMLDQMNERTARTTDLRPGEIADLELRYSPRDLAVKIKTPDPETPSAPTAGDRADESSATDASPTTRGDR